MNYTENHHITPKFMLKHKSKDFINDPRNLVKLEYKYHVAAHKWLFILTGDEIALNTWEMMSGRKTNPMGCDGIREKRNKKMRSKEYREAQSKLMKKKYSNPEERLKTGLKTKLSWENADERRKENSLRMSTSNPMSNPEQREKQSKRIKNMALKQCPHCDKQMRPANLAYHIKCKHS